MKIKLTDICGEVDYEKDLSLTLQPWINSHESQGVVFEVPSGLLRTAKTIDFTPLGDWRMVGEGSQRSTFIMAGADWGPTIKTEGNIFSCEDVAFIGNLTGALPILILPNPQSIESPTNSGVGFWSNNTQGGQFTRVRFAGQIGCLMYDPFMCNWNHCAFNGQNGRLTDNGSVVGAVVHRGTDCSFTNSCDFTGWREGLRISGAGVSVQTARFEVNGIGIRAGFSPDGFPWALVSSIFQAMTMEANDTGILLQVGNGLSFESITISGTDNSPSTMPSYGMNIQTASNCRFGSIGTGGWFSQAGLYLRPTNSENKRLRFTEMQINNINEQAKRWDLPEPDMRDAIFENCDL